MIKVSEVEEEVRRLAKARPYFQYMPPGGHLDSCQYLDEQDGQLVGSCIVGQALVNLGVDKEKLLKQEGLPAYTVLANLCETDDKDAQEWIDYVQGRQDAGQCWEQAVYQADLYALELG
ncbi:hypothetical protein SEA_WEASELS2_18 [Rhodococcus phage Weasels2]|uniref:Uncharacterized protein n=1 Tax=Rhodococcus phage Weasels2 TaxID=1897437 RepID=A0A1I9SA02_9CAUD|nr:hypothetical protein FDH04_gp018 [Rhodococcus phage Weasels2]AOZ63608.1 hypothetical protein SEA_WEASELS2_18 [Rhodococcus phage Weasels2]